MAEAITRPGTVEQFIKSQFQIRVSPEALEAFIVDLSNISQAVTEKAVALARAEGRQTLNQADVNEAFRSTAPPGDDGPILEPARLFKQIDRI
jgi:histone H3/H4